MRDLIIVRKHLTLSNERVQELEYQLSEAQYLHHHYPRTRRILSLTLVIAVSTTVYLGYNNMKYGAENRQFAKELTQSENRVHNMVEVLDNQKDKVDELTTANEQLIKYCNPSAVNRAIRATPLPARGV